MELADIFHWLHRLKAIVSTYLCFLINSWRRLNSPTFRCSDFLRMYSIAFQHDGKQPSLMPKEKAQRPSRHVWHKSREMCSRQKVATFDRNLRFLSSSLQLLSLNFLPFPIRISQSTYFFDNNGPTRDWTTV